MPKGPPSVSPQPEAGGVLHGMGVGGPWEKQTGLSEGITGTRILLTASRNPPGSLPMSCWGHLTCRSPQLAHRHPDCSICLPHTHPCPVSHSLCTLKVASMSLCRGLVSMHGKPACEIQRKHANSSISTTLREARGRQHMAWLCRVERRFPPKEGTRDVKQVYP